MCGIAGALSLALLGGLGIFVIAIAGRGSALDKELSTTITMAVCFTGIGAVAGWFGGRRASRLIKTGDTLGSGAAKVGGSAAGVGAAVGSLCGLPFGAVGAMLGGLIGVAVFGTVGAGLGLLFVALKRSKTKGSA